MGECEYSKEKQTYIMKTENKQTKWGQGDDSSPNGRINKAL